MMKCIKLRSYVCRLEYFYIFYHNYFGTSKSYFFFLGCEGKIKILRGYCGNASPNWYTRPRALFDDMDMSEKKSMIGKAPKGRITQEKGGGIKSKEIIPLG